MHILLDGHLTGDASHAVPRDLSLRHLNGLVKHATGDAVSHTLAVELDRAGAHQLVVNPALQLVDLLLLRADDLAVALPVQAFRYRHIPAADHRQALGLVVRQLGRCRFRTQNLVHLREHRTAGCSLHQRLSGIVQHRLVRFLHHRLTVLVDRAECRDFLLHLLLDDRAGGHHNVLIGVIRQDDVLGQFLIVLVLHLIVRVGTGVFFAQLLPLAAAPADVLLPRVVIVHILELGVTAPNVLADRAVLVPPKARVHRHHVVLLQGNILVLRVNLRFLCGVEGHAVGSHNVILRHAGTDEDILHLVDIVNTRLRDDVGRVNDRHLALADREVRPDTVVEFHQVEGCTQCRRVEFVRVVHSLKGQLIPEHIQKVLRRLCIPLRVLERDARRDLRRRDAHILLTLDQLAGDVPDDRCILR